MSEPVVVRAYGPDMSGIRTDLYPVRLKLDGTGYDKARLVVTTDDRGVLWVEQRRQLSKLRDTQIASMERDTQTKNRWTVTTTEGEVWYLDPSGGCGCGSPLKRMTRTQALA